jgi:hypothetical protein
MFVKFPVTILTRFAVFIEVFMIFLSCSRQMLYQHLRTGLIAYFIFIPKFHS